MPNNDTMSNAKHTPEPWKPPKAGHTYLSVSMSGADYERARLCVNKCAGIQDLSSAVLVPVETLGKVREFLRMNLGHYQIKADALLDLLAALGGES